MSLQSARGWQNTVGNLIDISWLLTYIYIYILCVYIYIYRERERSTVEVVLFGSLNSMRPYPSVCHACWEFTKGGLVKGGLATYILLLYNYDC